jgi:hypothetical protein
MAVVKPSRIRSLVLVVAAGVGIALLQSSSLRAANPAADLDQCRNGSQDAPVACDGGAWVNGNAGASNAHWNEGDSIAYRMRFTNLVPKTAYYVELEWDTTVNGKHAIDYLTSYNRTMSGGPGSPTYANPCSGVTLCSGTPTDTEAIPADTNTGLTPSAPDGRWNQLFQIWGADITSIEVIGPVTNPAYAVTGDYAGSSQTRIYINFIPSRANPVMAWGGHIATRKDWSCPTIPGGCSAAAISGSPFHMRLLGLSGTGGNQDRSLSSAAVVFPAVLRITKEVTNFSGSATHVSPTAFNFTTTSPTLNGAPEVPAAFQLWDDAAANPDVTPKTTSFNLFLFKTSQTGNQVTVTETAPGSAFALDSLTCVDTDGGLGIATGRTIVGGTATIYVNEAQTVDCTYTNKEQGASLTLKKTVINDNGSNAGASAFTMHIKSGGSDSVTPFAGSETGTTSSLAPGTYVVSEDGLSTHDQTKIECQKNSGAATETATVTLAAGDTATCTITNDDKPATLIVQKIVINDNGQSKKATDFTFQVNGGTATSFIQDGNDTLKGKNTLSTLSSGAYAVTEPAVTGYTTTYSTDCSVTLTTGETKTCTITNDDNPGTPTLATTMSWKLYDKATIGGGFVANAPTPTKITFKLWGPGQGCVGTPLFEQLSTAAVTGVGDYEPVNNGVLVTTPGTYHWVASWPGDENNTGKTSACGDESHTITILDPPK